MENPADPFVHRIHVLEQAKNLYVVIVDLTQGGGCFGLAKVAEGTGKVVNADNDLTPFLRPNTNTNAFGFTAQGKLTRPSGASAHYNGVSKCHWDGEDIATLKCVDMINLK